MKNIKRVILLLFIVMVLSITMFACNTNTSTTKPSTNNNEVEYMPMNSVHVTDLNIFKDLFHPLFNVYNNFTTTKINQQGDNIRNVEAVFNVKVKDRSKKIKFNINFDSTFPEKSYLVFSLININNSIESLALEATLFNSYEHKTNNMMPIANASLSDNKYYFYDLYINLENSRYFTMPIRSFDPLIPFDKSEEAIKKSVVNLATLISEHGSAKSRKVSYFKDSETGLYTRRNEITLDLTAALTKLSNSSGSLMLAKNPPTPKTTIQKVVDLIDILSIVLGINLDVDVRDSTRIDENLVKNNMPASDIKLVFEVQGLERLDKFDSINSTYKSLNIDLEVSADSTKVNNFRFKGEAFTASAKLNDFKSRLMNKNDIKLIDKNDFDSKYLGYKNNSFLVKAKVAKYEDKDINRESLVNKLKTKNLHFEMFGRYIAPVDEDNENKSLLSIRMYSIEDDNTQNEAFTIYCKDNNLYINSLVPDNDGVTAKSIQFTTGESASGSSLISNIIFELQQRSIFMHENGKTSESLKLSYSLGTWIAKFAINLLFQTNYDPLIGYEHLCDTSILLPILTGGDINHFMTELSDVLAKITGKTTDNILSEFEAAGLKQIFSPTLKISFLSKSLNELLNIYESNESIQDDIKILNVSAELSKLDWRE